MTFIHRDGQICIQTKVGVEPVLGAHINRDTGEFAIITKPHVARQFHWCSQADISHYRNLLDQRGNQ